VPTFSDVQDNDFILAVMFGHDNRLSANPSLPTGFTQLLAEEETAGNDDTILVGYRIASSEPGSGTYDFTYPDDEDVSAAVVAFRGVDTSTPWDVTYSKSDHYSYQLDLGIGSPGDLDPDDITTATDGAFVICIYTASGARSGTNDPPSGYTIVTDCIRDHYRAKLLIAYREVASAGNEDPGIWDTNPFAGQDGISVTLALKPASEAAAASSPFPPHFIGGLTAA
jgi:hypothetical protein